VPLVIVPDPVADVTVPDSTLTGINSVPPNVPVEVVMVKGALALAPVTEVSGTVALNAPLAASPPVSVAVPVAVRAEPAMATVALMLSVALEVAAWAAAQINNDVRTSRIDLLLLGLPSSGFGSSELANADGGLLERVAQERAVDRINPGGKCDLTARFVSSLTNCGTPLGTPLLTVAAQ
jgi:hypothetical protein